MISDGAKCAQHPERIAREVCSRCGAFLCAACVKTFARKPVCAACEQVLQSAPPSRLALAARNTVATSWALFVLTWLGVFLRQAWMLVGICVTPPVALIGGVLAIVELVGWSAPRSRRVATFALIGAVLHTGAALIGFALLYAMFSAAPEQR